jgi:DNA polymerase-4
LPLKPRDLTGIGRSIEARLFKQGITTTQQLWDLDAKTLRRIWGSVGGEEFWYKLHGHNLPEKATTRRTVGHSHVLAPQFRPNKDAFIVATRLTTKAASRLRRLGFYAAEISFSVRTGDDKKIKLHKKFRRSNDTQKFLEAITEFWQSIKAPKIKKISVTLHGLTAEADLQPELFDMTAKTPQKLSKAIDVLNAKFGRDTVVYGALPKATKSFSGTKIAFDRIPDFEEFYE